MPVAHEDALLVLLRVEQVVERILGQLADRRVEVPAMGLAHGLDDLHPPRRIGGQQAADPERSRTEALVRSRDQDRGIDLELGAQAGAARAGAVRGVEREVAGLELVDREAVVGTAVLLAVALLLERRRLAVARRRGDQHGTFAETQGRLDRIGQTGGVRVGHDQTGLGIDRPTVVGALRTLRRLGVAHDVAVDHDFDRVALVLVELGGVGDVVELPIHPDADEPLPPSGVHDAIALRLAVLDQRTEDEETGSLLQCDHLVDDLLDALALDRMAVGAVRDADPREQQPQVVVDLCDGPHRGARIPTRALLVDRDRRREAVDLVDVRLLHLAKELARIRG